MVTAPELAKSVGGLLSLDDGSYGVKGNHLRAWQFTAATPAPWAAVIEDDAEPVPDFLAHAEAALAAAPAPVVSFYPGRTPPEHRQPRISKALQFADRDKAHSIRADTVMHGVALATRDELRG